MNSLPISASSPPSEPLVYLVDREHGGIRFVVLSAFFAVWVLGFVVVSSIMASDGPNLIALLAGFVAAYAVTWFLERTLKRVWQSGRTLTLDRDGVRLALRGQIQTALLSEDPATALLWRFTIEKRARIPKGWSMVACALEHEGQYICAYTFMSPTAVETYPQQEKFKKLIGKKKSTLNDGREDLRLAGEQKRLRAAEDYRWIGGAEMPQDDFVAFIDNLILRFPEWMSSK